MTDLEKRLTSELNRRRFLQASAFTGVAAFVAACGTGGTGSAAPSEPAATAGASAGEPSASEAAPAESPSAELNFANWPLYIDTDDDDSTKHKTLEDFTAKYGTVVNYSEVINANDEFFGTIRPALEGGQDTRLGHRGPDRLDGRPPDPARLGRGVQPRQHAQQGRQHAGRLQGRQLRSDRRPPRAVAVGHDRARL